MVVRQDGTYGLYHETASAFHPKRPCGWIARSLVAHHSSIACQASSGHLSVGGDGQPHFRSDWGVWITYLFRLENDWVGVQRRRRMNEGRGLGLDGWWWWFLNR